MASKSAPPLRLSSNQTALAIVVPSHLQPEIDTLRKIHDKAYRKWEPHINILYPFVESSILSSAVSVVRAHLSSQVISPFKVRLENVGTFEHRRNATVFLKPGEESEGRICELRKQLVGALGRDEGEGTHDGVFKPHLTVGQAGLLGPTKARLVEKVGKLMGLEWEVDRLIVLRREKTGEMTVEHEISLRSSDGGEVENNDFVDDGWRICFQFTPEFRWNQLSRRKICPSNDRTGPIEVAIASYNLMSEPQAPHFRSRVSHIVEAISESTLRSSSSLRVLCLQEVDEEMLPLLLENPILFQLLPFSTHRPSSLLPSKRNLVTLSNEPFSCFTIQFAERHKSALVVSFCDLPVQVVNVHLTSALTDEAVATKRGQIEILTEFVMEAQASNKKNIFIAGDFNLTTSSKTIEIALSQRIITSETAQSVREVIDTKVWGDAFVALGSEKNDMASEELYEGEEGATFDRLSNPLASMSKTVMDNRPQRYDRVLFIKGTEIQPLYFEIFGRPTGDGKCWSDHYGICARFQIQRTNYTQPGVRTKNVQQLIEKIKIIEDSTNIEALIAPYIPTDEDRKKREHALILLKKTLSQSNSLKDLILAPLGSYAMDTYFADSDVDVLIIASISPQMFFDFATEHLQTLGISADGADGRFKGVHFINSLVSIIEVNILGIKFDIQYCQAPELLRRYHAKSEPDFQSIVHDPHLLKALSPSSLRPLTTYLSTQHLLSTLPFPCYSTIHRYLALYLKSRGLYSAKFSYLGGIHLSLLLNHLFKSIPSPPHQSPFSLLSPASIIRTFFTYYSTFDWEGNVVADPELHKGNERREKRDALFIPALHLPTARPNVAASCTRLSALTISSEFERTKELLERGEWEASLRPKSESVKEFLGNFGAYIRIEVQVWDLDELGSERIREVVGAVESKVCRVLVLLGGIEGVQGRVWPEKFRCRDENAKDEEGLKGSYLVGVSAHGESHERKRIVNAKVLTAVRDFESMVREAREVRGGNVWVGVDVVSRRKVAEMGMRVDDRDWGLIKDTTAKQESEETTANQLLTHQKRQTSSLRPARDILARIKWDDSLDEHDFLIGYEDRFVGVKERDLSKWKSEQTDEEFIPMHRIVWVRRKGEEGEKVWDRRARVDLLFGTGVAKR